MRSTRLYWFGPGLFGLVLVGGCTADDDSRVDTNPNADPADFREGVYEYVLGYDEHSGTRIVGGSHSIVSFDNGKREAFGSSNRAGDFHPDLQPGSDYFRYDATLSEGESDTDVFASTWWPQSRNGTAWRWQPGTNQNYSDLSDRDRLSPLEKYDLMFYPDQPQQVAAVSHCAYADYVEDPENCTRIEHPAVTVAGPATRWELQNQGVYQSVEPENWWGHCNGWASYATAEPLGYPRRDIRVRRENGQLVECIDSTEGCTLWRMADIEALMTEVYFSDRATFTGRRCEQRPDQMERDEFGRPLDPACRDLNAGAFHIALTGLFGRGARDLVSGESDRRPAFVIDHNYDHEVWNFPVFRFEVHSQEELTADQANALVGATGSGYQFNTSAARFVRVSASYWMISDGVPASQLLVRADQRSIEPMEVRVNYVLELDANAMILGGEWTEDPSFTWIDNKALHPDFMWMALDAQGYGEGSDDLGGTGDNPYVSYVNARALLSCANDPTTCAPQGGGGETEILAEAGQVARNGEVRFETGTLEPGRYTVRLRHDPAAPGGDADLYVRTGAAPTTAVYDCRPYASGSNEECLVELADAANIHIMVRGWGQGNNAFVLEVTGQGGANPPPGWEGLDVSGTVARNEEDRFETPLLTAGAYVFEMTGNNDADLYVRVGTAPTTSSYDCRPYATGSAETCTVQLSAPAVVHLMVRGYASATSSYAVSGRPQ